VRISPSGLRQRVPGRQLPVTPAPAVSSVPPSSAAALAARDMVEAFEAGVRRAEEITEALPGPAAPPAWPLVPAAGGPYGAALPAPPVMPASSAAPPVVPVVPAERPGPAVARALRRRTPGATLDTETVSHPPNPLWSAADQDPAAVRSLVEQFESGVARALRDASDGTDTAEGASG